MKRKRSLLLLTLLVLTVLAAVPFIASYRQWRQARLNHDLIAAINANNVPAVTALLNAGADANTRDNGEPPPSFREILRRWLRNDKPGASATTQETPAALSIAVNQHLNPDMGGDSGIPAKDVRIVQALLEHGADPNAVTYYGRPPLILATWTGPLQTIRLLLEHGARVDARDEQGRTALLWAAGNREIEVIRMFLDKGADVNVQDVESKTALLRMSSQKDMEEAVRLLLEHHADVNKADTQGETPLSEAKFWKRAKTIALLCKAGAKR